MPFLLGENSNLLNQMDAVSKPLFIASYRKSWIYIQGQFDFLDLHSSCQKKH
jgi:hypothetical protein